MATSDQLAAAPLGLAEPARYGEVYDRGYKHYDGPRLGRRHAFWALVVYSMKRAVGIKKGWTSKIIPIILYVAMIVPVVVGIGVEAFLPQADFLTYAEFFIIVFLVEGIFVATIAPEMLCGDRREHVLPLYFSRAITRFDYLVAKLVAAAILTMTVSWMPLAFYWLGLQFLEPRPLNALRTNADDLGRIVLAGSLVALYLGALGLLVSSFTGRKSIAVAVIIVGFVIFEALGGLLTSVLDPGRVRDLAIFLSPAGTTASMVIELFQTPDRDEIPYAWWIYAGGMLGVVLACCGVMYWRYVPDE